MDGTRGTQAAPGPDAAPSRTLDLGLGLGLLLLTLAVYARAVGAGFINYDDGEYVTRNPHLVGGVTLDFLRWAFTSAHSNNWHPLTWLSHAVDLQLFGKEPAGHHAVNVVLHGVNTVALFAFLRLATGARWRSALVAALFALHPLHVQSVAWVAERKDVLSTFFWLLTLLAYLGWTRRGGAGRYALVVLAMALGLMAKPMLVTLPFVLLLLDAWPLERLGLRGEGLVPRLVEKLPLFVLAAISSALTLWAQSEGGAVVAADAYPLGARIANAFHAYASYLGLTFWPTGLAIFYPFVEVSDLRAGLAALLIAALGAAALHQAQPTRIQGRRPA